MLEMVGDIVEVMVPQFPPDKIYALGCIVEGSPMPLVAL
jgi:hypothetical protein